MIDSQSLPRPKPDELPGSTGFPNQQGIISPSIDLRGYPNLEFIIYMPNTYISSLNCLNLLINCIQTAVTPRRKPVPRSHQLSRNTTTAQPSNYQAAKTTAQPSTIGLVLYTRPWLPRPRRKARRCRNGYPVFAFHKSGSRSAEPRSLPPDDPGQSPIH